MIKVIRYNVSLFLTNLPYNNNEHIRPTIEQIVITTYKVYNLVLNQYGL